MKLKRFAAAALAFCLMLTLLPGGVSAEDGLSGAGWKLEGDTLYITDRVSSTSGANWASSVSSIKHVDISKNVTSISPTAFQDCVELLSFTVENGNTAFSAGDDGVLYSFNKDTIMCYPAARTNTCLGDYDLGYNLYMVPESVLKIKPLAFEGLINKGAQLKIYAYEDTLASVYSNYVTKAWDDFPNTDKIETLEYVPVRSVSLDQDVLRVEVDKTADLKATVLPANATFPQVLWSCAPEAFAEVEGGRPNGNVTTGTVTGKSAGTAKIVVTTVDKGFPASCTVTVVKEDVQGLKLDQDKLELKLDKDEDKIHSLTATLTPANATDKTIIFRSTDPNVVKLSTTGAEGDVIDSVTVTADKLREDGIAATVYVHAVNPGTASIEAFTRDQAQNDACKVTVEAESFKLAPEELKLTKGNESTVRVNPDTAVGPVIWYSSNDGIVEVTPIGEDGLTATVKAVGAGTAAIVAQTGDGKRQSCAVTVWDPPGKIAISMTELTLAPQPKVGETVISEELYTKQLYAVIEPLTADQSVTWAIVGNENENEKVATVDQNGKVTAHKNGKVTVTATSTADPSLRAECVLTVRTSVTGVTLNKNTLELAEDKTETLTATVEPSGASDDTVVWYSSNEDIAGVDSSGTVTAKKPGTARIIAVTKDGGETAECTVTVKATKVTGVTLDKTAVTLTLEAHTEEQLTATVLPDSAENKTVTWISSDTNIVTVSQGGGLTTTLTAKATGAATITVTTNDGAHTATCTVKVVPNAVTRVELDKTALELAEGGAGTLTATLTPANATNKNVEWKSSNTDIAEVTSNGFSANIAAKKAGTAVITVTTDDGRYTASCAVTVLPITAEKIELDSSISLEKGETETLTAKLYPYNATNKKIVFLSTDPSVATINGDGVTKDGLLIIDAQVGGAVAEESPATASVTVTAHKPGTATIIAATADGGIVRHCTVTVYQPVETVTIIPGHSMTLDVNESAVLKAIVMPEGASQEVTWTSDKESVATVENGKVTAVSPGTAKITATSVAKNKGDSPVTATCDVTVRVPVTAITLRPTSTLPAPNVLEWNLNEKPPELDLEAKVEPTDATNKTVRWYSSNPDVATVNGGHVEAKKPGTAVIIAAADDNGEVTASYPVTVRYRVEGVELNQTSLTLEKGTSFGLTATVKPDGTADQSVTWTSGDESVATVKNGVVTAVSPGTTTITATSVSDTTRTQNCTVTVTEKSVSVTKVSLDKSSLTLTEGNKGTLIATIDPTNATNKGVKFLSTNPDVIKFIVNEESGDEALEAETERVAGNGKATVAVKAVGSGTATVIATTADGRHMAYCIVTVQANATGVTLNRTSMTLSIHGTETLTATVEPYDAANKNVTFKILNGEGVIELLSGSGSSTNVYAKKAGTATVRVTTADGGLSADCDVTVSPTPVKSVTIQESSLTLHLGQLSEGFPLNVTISPSDSTEPEIKWSSSEPKVAEVNSDGKVKAIGPGTALITATVTDQAEQVYTASCLVTVKPVDVTGVTLETTNLTLVKGTTDSDTLKKAVKVQPVNATNKTVTWSSSDGSVASVDKESGAVTAVSAGIATIAASTSDGGYTAFCTVTVVETDRLTLDKTTLFLAYIEGKPETDRLTATFQPSETEPSSVTWTSDKEGVAKVENGVVTAVGPGTAKITATVQRDGGDFTATCDVTVFTLKIVPSELALATGKFAKLAVEVKPENAGINVTWHSLNPAVAEVKIDGSVTAVGPGKTAIYAVTEDGGYTASCVVTVWTALETFKIIPPTLDLTPEGKADLAVIVNSGANPDVIWSVDPAGVVEVQDGVVTAIKAGTATITAASAMDSFIKGTCIVTVKDETTPVTSVRLNKKSLELKAKDGDVPGSEQLTATVTPSDATDQNVSWKSTDTKVATVEDGMVTAVNPGTATIIVTTRDGNFTDWCTVTVSGPEPVKASSVRIERDGEPKSALTLTVNDLIQLSATVLPETTTDKTVTWESSDTNIAMVSNGLVTAKASGMALITATTANGIKANCTVTVKDTPVKAESVSIESDGEEAKELTLTVNAQVQLFATVLPETTTDKTVTWKSSDPAVTVSSSGLVTALEPGKAAITATTENGKSATCIVTVEAEPVAVDSVKIDSEKTEIEMNKGEYMLLTATVEPSNATNQTITWSSSSPSVATVDENRGIVEAVGPGEAKITAKAGEKEAKITVKVRTPADKVEMADKLTLGAGTQGTLTATVMAGTAKAYNQTVAWYSSDNEIVKVEPIATEDNTAKAIVTAKNPGTATIIAVSEDGGHTATCTVTVPGIVAVTGPASLSVGKTAHLTAVTVPANADLTWECEPNDDDDGKVIVSKDGTVTANEKGTVTIKATLTVDGVTDSTECKIEITETQISLTSAEMKVSPGETGTIDVTIETSSAETMKLDLDVKCTDLNGGATDVAEASEPLNPIVNVGNGISSYNEKITVTAKNPGTALVTVTATDADSGEVYSATCVVTVPPVSVKKVTLNKTRKIWTEEDSSLELTATVSADGDGQATNPEVIWITSDESVAALSAESGNNVTVTARKPGKATITVVTLDGGHTASCEIIVPGITLSKNDLTLYEGETAELFAFLTPAGLENVQWSWSLGEDESAATVVGNDTKATVTAKETGEGPVTITVTASTADGDKIATETCTVKVEKKTEISLNETSFTLTSGSSGQNSKQLTVSGAGENGVTWSSSKPDVATVDEHGNVTAARDDAYGTAVITATAVDGGCTASCVVTVWKTPTEENVTISKSSLTLGIGDTWALTASAGENENPEVKWAITGEEGSITVKDGLITAKTAGKATIIATFVGGATVTCEVTVLEYKFSSEIALPRITITDNGDKAGKKVDLADTEGNQIYYAMGDSVSFIKYTTSIEIEQTATIRAYAVRGSEQSAVVTSVITVGEAQSGSLLTDSRGNTVDTVAEAMTSGAVMANITLTEEAVEAAEETPDIYLAVYDTRGALIALEKHEVQLSGAGGQVVSQLFDLDIPDGTEVGLIRLMVLSKDKSPIMSAGMLSG